MKTQWWKSSVVYQIYPRSFNDSNSDGVGDIPGITQKLSYLAELGIDIIWLSPVYQSPNDDNGYDISDYREIMTEFGTMTDFDQMLFEAHKHGIKIMMDLVVNHTSDEHAWFVESRSSKDSPYRDYYIWKKGINGGPPTNWGASFGGSVWEYDQESDEYFLHLFSKKQPDLNWENDQLRQEIYDMMKFWLDKGVDGFRMDVVNFISKDQRYLDGPTNETNYGDGSSYYVNGPRIHEFIQEMNHNVLRNYDTITVGEMPFLQVEDAKLFTADYRNELNMVFHFEHVDIGNGKFGKWTPQSWNLIDLKRIFSQWQYGLEEQGWNSLYWSNHDQPRAISRFGNDSEQFRVISGKMLATCLHLLKGTPYIYQGEEIGMTNTSMDNITDYRDIESLNSYHEYVDSGLLSHEQMMNAIHERGRDNARTPMQWSDEAHGGFTTGEPWIAVNPNYKEINVAAAVANPASIFYYYKKLIQLRKTNRIVVEGKYNLILDDHEQIYAYTREWENERWLIICNFSKEQPVFKLPENMTFKTSELVISNYEVDDGDIAAIALRPYEARVYKLN